MAHIFWIVYLGMLGTVAIGFFIKGKYKTSPAKLDFVISMITWIGLLGYVTNTEIINSSVWKVVFFGSLIWDVTYSFFLADYEEEFKGVAPPYRFIILAATFVFLLGPLYYGLYQYAF